MKSNRKNIRVLANTGHEIIKYLHAKTSTGLLRKAIESIV